MKEYLLSILQGFIPIILILGIVFEPQLFIMIANTSLGKVVAIVISMFYFTSTDYIYGVLASMIFILFYQSDHVVAMSRMSVPDDYYLI